MVENNTALLIAIVALVAVIGILGLLALNAATTASTSVLASMTAQPATDKSSPSSPAEPACKAGCWKAVGDNIVTVSLCHIPDEQRDDVACKLGSVGFTCYGAAGCAIKKPPEEKI